MNYYEVLGVNNNSEESKQKFILLVEAYNILSNEQSRKEYDISLSYDSPYQVNSHPQEHTIPPASTIADFLYYQNSSFGIGIQYPSNWVIDDVKYYNPYDERFTQIVGFLSPSKDNSGVLHEKVSISIKYLHSDNVGLYAYTNSQMDELIRKYSKAYDFILLESSKVFLAGSPASKLEYVFTYKHGKPYIRSMEIWTIRHTKAYHISYEAYSLEFADYLPIIQKMIDSFEILEAR
jgi:hypothetical protein